MKRLGYDDDQARVILLAARRENKAYRRADPLYVMGIATGNLVQTTTRKGT